MESLKRGHELEIESLIHEAELKQKDAEVYNKKTLDNNRTSLMVSFFICFAD